jgi:DNA polymerase IV
MVTRTILHADMNNFYASVECLYRPELRGKPVAVCGDPELRHGIVLAKNYPAKATGIKTGEAIWQARQKCPDLTVLPPNFSLYLEFAQYARKIYADYTSRIWPCGLDEAWLDVTESGSLFGDGEAIANRIRERIKSELGITASVGVSFNKIFSKLGSDMKKPDATTVISMLNYKEKVWPLPVQELLYVGRATHRELAHRNINTIGDLALHNVKYLIPHFGKWGEVLHDFANGRDYSQVANFGEESIIKSIGNSTTTPRDLICSQDVRMVFYVLAESVAARLREHGFVCRTVQIHIRDTGLISFERQGKLSRPTNLSGDIFRLANELFIKNYNWNNHIRSLGLRACDLAPSSTAIQTNLFVDEERRAKQQKLEETLDTLRRRYGYYCLQRAVMLEDKPLHINPKDDHVIHPMGLFNGPLPVSDFTINKTGGADS